MQITDRAKDVIKSGGEWISSIDLENLAVGHPKVAEAAVIGVKHPKWDERPLLVIVLKKGQRRARRRSSSFMQGKIAKWWMPDDVVFVDEIPHTATGKIQKTVLRERFKELRAADRRRREVNRSLAITVRQPTEPVPKRARGDVAHGAPASSPPRPRCGKLRQHPGGSSPGRPRMTMLDATVPAAQAGIAAPAGLPCASSATAAAFGGCSSAARCC